MKVKKATILVLLALILTFSMPLTGFSLSPMERELVLQGEQHGIGYQIFKTRDYYIVRFHKDSETILNTQITELVINLEIENGRLLSVAPTGEIKDNKSTYKFSSRKGLNSQLEEKGLFLIFKFSPEEKPLGKLSFSVTEYTPISKTSVTKESNLITFSLE